MPAVGRSYRIDNVLKLFFGDVLVFGRWFGDESQPAGAPHHGDKSCVNVQHKIATRVLHFISYLYRGHVRQTDIIYYTWYIKRGRPTVIFGQPSTNRISENRAHETAGKCETPKTGALGGRGPSRPHGVYARIHDSLSRNNLKIIILRATMTYFKSYEWVVI